MLSLNNRLLFQPEKSAFTIFCDENEGVSNPKALSKVIPKVLDKENVVPPPASTNFGTVKVVESFSSDSSDSSDCMDLESPMILDTSVQQLDWRVPPLDQHKPESVDVFSVPEYSEVELQRRFFEDFGGGPVILGP